MINDAPSITTIKNIGVNCVVGMLLAYDSSANQYIPANPAWVIDALTGGIKPAESAYIVGLLLSKNADNTGTLLTRGVVTDSVKINYLTGSGASGSYYLVNGGTAVNVLPAGTLPVYCGTKIDANTFFLNPAPPVYGGHSHDLCLLDASQGTWTNSGTVYTASSTSIASQIMVGVPTESIAVIHNGALLLSGTDYSLSSNTLTLSGGLTSVGSYQLSPINRLIATDPEVRAIAPAADNDVLKTSKSFGTVYLDTNFTPVSTGQLPGTAVVGITNAGVSTGPVVQTLDQGTGISINSNGSGGYIINNDVYGDYLDLQIINAHNVLIGNGVTDNLVTFPAGINSDITGLIRLPGERGGRVVRAFAWMVGAGGGLQGSMTVQMVPGTSESVTPGGEITLNAPAGAGANSVSEVITSGAALVTSSGYDNALTMISISATTPATAIQVKAIGLKLINESAE